MGATLFSNSRFYQHQLQKVCWQLSGFRLHFVIIIVVVAIIIVVLTNIKTNVYLSGTSTSERFLVIISDVKSNYFLFFLAS